MAATAATSPNFPGLNAISGPAPASPVLHIITSATVEAANANHSSRAILVVPKSDGFRRRIPVDIDAVSARD
jgi:hypothetical protein